MECYLAYLPNIKQIPSKKNAERETLPVQGSLRQLLRNCFAFRHCDKCSDIFHYYILKPKFVQQGRSENRQGSWRANPCPHPQYPTPHPRLSEPSVSQSSPWRRCPEQIRRRAVSPLQTILCQFSPSVAPFSAIHRCSEGGLRRSSSSCSGAFRRAGVAGNGTQLNFPEDGRIGCDRR